MLTGGADRQADAAAQTRICKAMTKCRAYGLASGRHALHLERDAVRIPWLAAIDSFVRTRAGSRPILIQSPPAHGL